MIVKQVERRNFGRRRIGREIENGNAFVMAERVGHVSPVEDMARPP
jgi:hypothetical protein